MNWILGFLKKFFPNLFGGLAKFVLGFLGPLVAPFILFFTSFLRKVGLFMLILAAIAAAIFLFATVIEELVSGLVLLTAPSWIEVGRMLLPSNISYCLGLLIFARLKSLVFMWTVRLSEKFLHT
ncbi:MAG: hypothetical protein E2579_27615 [Pseudomonas sp.]|nr:hypothetical protein [Pseudomonas sp.]MPT21459.1 hypothetical protein [Pseudomonas sp.]